MTSLDFISWFIFFGLTGTTIWLVVTYLRPENVALRKFNEAVKQKDFALALSHCEDGLTRDPNSVNLLVNASAMCIPLKEFEKTLEFCNRGLAITPGNVNLLCNRSAANNNLSRFEEAELDASKAIELDSKQLAAYLNRAFAYLVQRKYKEAVADCNQAQSMNMLDVDIIHAEALNSMNRFDEAMKICQNAMSRMESQSIDADLSGLYVTRGNIYHGMRKPKEAIADFDEAIRINPRCEPAYVNRSGSYLMLGDMKKAQDELDNLNRMKISESLKAYPMYTQIRVYIKQNEWQKAWKVASMALEKYPNSPIVNAMVAFLYLHDNKLKAALDHINKATTLDSFSREAHYIRHQIYDAMNEKDKAESDKKIATDFGYEPYLT
ncbi:MAG: tetratricopeptide repeat protein [Cyanobacteria bacterium TGS_CYA1]|nr:tetratricopeptide repeat protein [Cyanobacteria bacterium TGS_CYA1]